MTATSVYLYSLPGSNGGDSKFRISPVALVGMPSMVSEASLSGSSTFILATFFSSWAKARPANVRPVTQTNIKMIRRCNMEDSPDGDSMRYQYGGNMAGVK